MALKNDEGEKAFISKCLRRTQINTDYRILIYPYKCTCLGCTEEEKVKYQYFKIFIESSNHNFNQDIIGSCTLKNKFNRVLQYDTLLEILKKLEENQEFELRRTAHHIATHAIICGKNIDVVEKRITLILKAIYKYCTEDNYSDINSPSTFFGH